MVGVRGECKYKEGRVLYCLKTTPRGTLPVFSPKPSIWDPWASQPLSLDFSSVVSEKVSLRLVLRISKYVAYKEFSRELRNHTCYFIISVVINTSKLFYSVRLYSVLAKNLMFYDCMLSM